MKNMDFLEQLLDGQKVEWKKLGEVAEFYGGLTGKSKEDFSEGNAYYISYKNIYENYAVDASRLEKVNVEEGERQHAVQYGDVLITGSSENLEEAGMSSVVTFVPEPPIYLNSFSFGVRFHQYIELSPEFTKHLFRSHLMRKQIMNTAQGVTRFNVSKRRFATIEIPLPSLSVQSRIVEILDKYTALEAELEEQLQAEQSLRTKQYQHYREQLLNFSSTPPPHGFNVIWRKLGEVCDIKTGKGVTKKDAVKEGEYPIISGGMTPMGYIDKYNREANTVTVSRVGANAGFVNYLFEKFYLNDKCFSVIPQVKDIDAKFLFYVLKNREQQIVALQSLGGVPTINTTKLGSIEIPLPPLSEQARIVEILDKFDTLTNSISEGLPLEIQLRKQQYEYYREQLLAFPHP